ncbi:EamA family transporter RarD, partial [Streptomyces heliomycini]
LALLPWDALRPARRAARAPAGGTGAAGTGVPAGTVGAAPAPAPGSVPAAAEADRVEARP